MRWIAEAILGEHLSSGFRTRAPAPSTRCFYSSNTTYNLLLLLLLFRLRLVLKF